MIRIRSVQVVTSCRATNTADVHGPCAVRPAVLSAYFPIYAKAELLKPRQIGVSLQSPLLAPEMGMARPEKDRATVEETAKGTVDRFKTCPLQLRCP